MDVECFGVLFFGEVLFNMKICEMLDVGILVVVFDLEGLVVVIYKMIV